MSYRILGEWIRRMPAEYTSALQPLDERVGVYVDYHDHGPLIQTELDALEKLESILDALSTGWEGMTRIVLRIAHEMVLIAPYNRPTAFDMTRGFFGDDGHAAIVEKCRSKLSPEECEAWKKVDAIIQEVPDRVDLPLSQSGQAERRLS